MKKSTKTTLIALGLIGGVFALSSCTANFCTNKEAARLIYAFEPGVTQIFSSDDTRINDLPNTGTDTENHKQYYKESITTSNNIGITFFISYDTESKHYDLGEKTDQNYSSSDINYVIDYAASINTYVPSFDYFKAFDLKFLKNNTVLDNLTTLIGETGEAKTREIKEFYNNYGYLKFYDAESDNKWGNFDKTIAEFRNDVTLGVDKCPTDDFVNAYKTTFNSLADAKRSCITVIDGQYGSYGRDKFSVNMEATTWGEAWTKGGKLIEGLVVYPVAWMVDQFANLFAKGDVANYTTGVPQILSLLVVTIIVRLFLFLTTLKSTLSQQKMNELQPELAKIQQKYPNANTNDAQKQRLAEEQMRLYKKHGVNPLSSLLVLIIQFPLFIGVWGAMTGSAVLSTGAFLGLDLSASIWECLKIGPTATNPGWWTALVLILLMSAGQFFQMKVPQWLQKARTKKVSRLSRNPAEKQQNKTANIVSWVMLVMIIFMGFTLPAAMGVYWFIGALVSLAQSLIMNAVTNKKLRK